MGFSSAPGEGTSLATFERGSASRTSGSTAKSNDLTKDTKNLQTSNYQKARSSEETSLPSFSSVRFIQPGEGILPNMVRWKDDVRMKVWAWDRREEPSFNRTRHSHSSGCDRIRHNRGAWGRLPRCRNIRFSSSKSCRPAFKRGMTGRTTEQLSPTGIGCQIQDITEI